MGCFQKARNKFTLHTANRDTALWIYNWKDDLSVGAAFKGI